MSVIGWDEARDNSSTARINAENDSGGIRCDNDRDTSDKNLVSLPCWARSLYFLWLHRLELLRVEMAEMLSRCRRVIIELLL